MNWKNATRLQIVAESLRAALLNPMMIVVLYKYNVGTKMFFLWSKKPAKLRSKVQGHSSIERKVNGSWDIYKRSLTESLKDMRPFKRKAWRSFCEHTSTKEAASLPKVLSNDHNYGIGLMKKPGEEFTQNQSETIELIFSKFIFQLTE